MPVGPFTFASMGQVEELSSSGRSSSSGSSGRRISGTRGSSDNGTAVVWFAVNLGAGAGVRIRTAFEPTHHEHLHAHSPLRTATPAPSPAPYVTLEVLNAAAGFEVERTVECTANSHEGQGSEGNITVTCDLSAPAPASALLSVGLRVTGPKSNALIATDFLSSSAP